MLQPHSPRQVMNYCLLSLRRMPRLFALGTLLLTGLVGLAQQFTTDTSVIAAGGGRIAGGNFAILSTIGQPVPGRQTGGNFILEAGFIPTVTVLQTAGAPTLLLNYGPGNVLLNWAVQPAAFTLETTTTPHLLGSWGSVAGGPVQANGTNTFTVPVTAARQFFRLKSQ